MYFLYRSDEIESKDEFNEDFDGQAVRRTYPDQPDREWR